MEGGEKPRDGPDTSPHTVDHGRAKRRFDWRAMLRNRNSTSARQHGGSLDTSDTEQTPAEKRPARWNMGIMNAETDEVPGSVLLLSKVSEYNEPLGLRNAPARRSASSLPSIYPPSRSSSQLRRRSSIQEKKRTPDGQFVLDPQPDDSLNDPLNWSKWRRDAALLSLGFYCMLGGGMTAILAAGFNNVAHDYGVSEPTVALTTGLYMMGLGIGSVILSPTAILYGKRPVYLVASVAFALSGVWCALSPSFGSLVGARIFMGIAASSVECLPSATIAEIYFLHEKGYRLGIYTLLLLGGKNLVPLVSAAVIDSLGWRWVFWIVAIVVAFGGILLFLFVPETFWDRTPTPRRPKPRQQGSTWSVHQVWHHLAHSQPATPGGERKTRSLPARPDDSVSDGPAPLTKAPVRHAHFQTESFNDEKRGSSVDSGDDEKKDVVTPPEPGQASPKSHPAIPSPPPAVVAHDYFHNHVVDHAAVESQLPHVLSRTSSVVSEDPRNAYTKRLVSEPAQTWIQSLKPYAGRLSKDNWFKVALRPFILFAYPSLLWSALVYSLSIGWLIVISESITSIYKSRDTYNFTSLQAGLVYISPFVGGVLGTAVAGKFSDIVVRYMARKNGGIYEPEFRLVMAVPIAITTVIGLMGYGWSAEERDAWIVPTVFFGIISFGCSLGSTTSITFAVDSYRQYAGEALVTLNFSKNIFHGLIFSLFFNDWLESDGSEEVFLAIGGIQLACLFTTIPMYIYGKRARMWTVRKNLMEKF